MGAEEEDEPKFAGGNTAQSIGQRKAWWFKQPLPIDRFTGWLVAWTALLFVATVINAVILGITDHTLRDTLRETARAAKAAEESIKLGADTAKRQLRAYLTISKIDIECTNCTKKNGSQIPPKQGLADIRVLTVIKNSGTTPAYKVQICSGARLTAPNSFLADDFPFACEERCKTCPTITVGPSTEETVFLPLDVKDFMMASAGFNRLFYYGTVSFTDTFQAERKVPFCWFHQGPKDEAIGCPYHNTPVDD